MWFVAQIAVRRVNCHASQQRTQKPCNSARPRFGMANHPSMIKRCATGIHQRLGSGLLWSNADSAFGQRAVKSLDGGRYTDVADPERIVEPRYFGHRLLQANRRTLNLIALPPFPPLVLRYSSARRVENWESRPRRQGSSFRSYEGAKTASP